MAHECPECGLVCHCGSDIEDCLMNNEEDVQACIHCADLPTKDDEFDPTEVEGNDYLNDWT